MNKLRRILVATDLSPHSERAIVRAIRLAREHDARLTALTVVERAFSGEQRADNLVRAIFEAPGTVERDLIADAEAALRETIKRLARDEPPAHDVTARIGSVFGEILSVAREINADLIALGAHGRHYLRRLLLGTTAARVARHGERPVLVVRKPALRSYRRVLVATDFSAQARHALHVARGLVPAAEVQLLHAYEIWYEHRLHTGITIDEVRRLHLEYEEAARGELAALARDAGLDPQATPLVVRYGYAATLLPRAAAEWRADLIVAGTRGIKGLRYAFLGSVAEHILRESPCDVLVVPHGEPAAE